MERWGGVREYAGRVDFLYVLHRQLDRVARERVMVHGSDASSMNVFDYAPLTRYISAVEALCIMLPKQLREECGCAAGVDALWRLRGLDMLAHQFYEKGCEELLEQDEKLRKMLEEEREKAKEQGGKARAQPAAQPAQPAALEIHYGWERWLGGAARSPPAGGKSDTLKELERLVNDEEWRRKVSSCEELEREMEEEEKLIEEVLRSAGIVVKTYGDLGWLPLKVIAVADAVVQRIVDVLDAHQLLIPGRRVAVGVARGEAGRADRVGVEE
jgi:hypothetical protein